MWRKKNFNGIDPKPLFNYPMSLMFPQVADIPNLFNRMLLMIVEAIELCGKLEKTGAEFTINFLGFMQKVFSVYFTPKGRLVFLKHLEQARNYRRLTDKYIVTPYLELIVAEKAFK